MKGFIKQNYHWIVAFLVFLEAIIIGGLINCYSIFTIPMCEELNASRGDFSVAGMPYIVVSFFSTMCTGFLFQRFGYKKSAIASLILIAASTAIIACADSLIMYALGKILMGMGYGVCLTAGSVRIIRDWFHKHQGLVSGAVTMATGLGGSLLTVVLTALIERYDWRVAHWCVAVLVVLIALSYLLLKDRPEKMGLKPYGFGVVEAKKKAPTEKDWPGLPMKVLLRRPSFYLMNICVLISCACILATSTVVVPYYQDIGYSPEDAAMFQSVLMLTLAGAKFIGGGLCDRIGSKAVGILCMACGVAGQLIMALVSAPVASYAGVVIFSVGLCMTSIMVPMMGTALFGYQTSLSTNGIFLAMASVASLISSPITNICYDYLGSYRPVFIVAALVNVGVTALFFLLFALTKQDRKLHAASATDI